MRHPHRLLLTFTREIRTLSTSTDALTTATQRNTDATTALTGSVKEGTQAISDLATETLKIGTFLKQNPTQTVEQLTAIAAQIENNSKAIAGAAGTIHEAASDIESQIAETEALLPAEEPAPDTASAQEGTAALVGDGTNAVSDNGTQVAPGTPPDGAALLPVDAPPVTTNAVSVTPEGQTVVGAQAGPIIPIDTAPVPDGADGATTETVEHQPIGTGDDEIAVVPTLVTGNESPGGVESVEQTNTRAGESVVNLAAKKRP